MSNDGMDSGRRRFLTNATVAVGAVGAGAAAVPFLSSIAPSERAKALGAPVAVDISAMQPGELKIVPWRGKPVWVVRRTKEMIDSLTKVASDLDDPQSEEPQQPDYVKGDTRSLKPEYLVMVGSCTHLGCSPTFRPDFPAPEVDANWQGGFYCPCHGSKFDLSGRVYKGVPAPSNLVVPPHRYASATELIIGEDPTETTGAA